MTKLDSERFVIIPLTNGQAFREAREVAIGQQRALGYRFDSEEAVAEGAKLRFVPAAIVMGTTGNAHKRPTAERTPRRRTR